MLTRKKIGGHLFIAAAICVLWSACEGAELAELMQRWENPKTVRPHSPTGEPSGPYVSMAAEAAPDRMRKVHAQYMNSSQVAAHLRSGGDVAILPMGSMEAHGQRGPLSTRTLIAQATGVLLAERWNALLFPPIHYSCAPGAGRRPGTVSISVDDTLEYARAVIHSLLDGGFKRVVLLCADRSFDQHGRSLARSIHRERHQLPMYCRIDLLPNTEEIAKELGFAPGDDVRTMAALKILGHPGVFKGRAGTWTPTASERKLSELRSKARRAGVGAPSVGGRSRGEAGERTNIKQADVDKAIAIMRREARKYDTFPAYFAQNQKDVASQFESAPWTVDNYLKSMEQALAETEGGPFDWKMQPDHSAPKIPERSTADYRIPLSSLPPEARPEYKRRVRGEFIGAAEVARKLKRGQNVAILPIGAFEMHGPHGPLDTDTINSYSTAVMLAGHWNAIALPPIHYTYSGATELWPGSVSIRPEATVRYVKAVVKALFRAGFERVVLVWRHAPGGFMGRQVVRDIYREEGTAVFTGRLRADRERLRKELGYGSGEDISVLAGVKILGHPGVFVVNEPRDIPGKWGFRSGWELRKMGVVGRAWYMSLTTQHMQVRSCVKAGDEDKVIDAMREAAKKRTDGPEIMSDYLKELRKLEEEAPRD